MKWDHWIGHTDEGPVVMWIKNLVSLWGCRIDLHKFVNSDLPGCYHTHPAWALRVCLWGGYNEQYVVKEDRNTGAVFTKTREIPAGFIGLIRPQMTHRISGLMGKTSYSLWLRGPVIRKIRLVGPGWPNHLRSTSPLDDEL